MPVFESPKPAQEGGDDGDESGDVVEVGDDDNNTASTPPPAPVLVATLSRDDAENKTVSHTKPKVVVSIPEAPKTKDKTPRKPTYSTQSQRVSVSPPGQPSRPILQVSAPVPAPPPAPVPDVVFGVGVGKGKMPKPSEAPVQAPVKLPGLAGGNTSAQNSVNPNPCMTEFEEAITKVHLVMEEQQEGLNNHKRILKSMKDEQARDSNSLASFSRKYTEAMISIDKRFKDLESKTQEHVKKYVDAIAGSVEEGSRVLERFAEVNIIMQERLKEVDILNERAKMLLSLIRGKPVEDAPTDIILKLAIDECLNNTSSLPLRKDLCQTQVKEEGGTEEVTDADSIHTSGDVQCLLSDSYLKGLKHTTMKKTDIEKTGGLFICPECRDNVFIQQVAIRGCDEDSKKDVYFHGFLALNKSAEKTDEDGEVKIATRRYNFYNFDSDAWLKTSDALVYARNPGKNWKYDCHILKSESNGNNKVMRFSDFETTLSQGIDVIGKKEVFKDADVSKLLEGNPKKRRLQ